MTVVPRRHSLYFQDENIQVFITGIEKEEKEFTTRLDKEVAMKLEAVPVVFPVPHPLQSSGEDGIPAVVTGDLQDGRQVREEPYQVHRSNEEDLGLAVSYALSEPTGLTTVSHCHDHKDQEKTRKKKKKEKKEQIQSKRPVQFPI